MQVMASCWLASAAGATSVISTSRPTDLVLDEGTQTLYVTSGSRVLRISTATQMQSTPIQLSGLLGGIDQSADRRFLAVADRQKSGDEIGFYLIDLLLGTTKHVTYRVGLDATGVHSVVFGSDGAVYLTTAGSNWHPLRRYNIATGATFEVMQVGGDTMIAASGDRRFIGMVEPCSPSSVYRFSVETYEVVSARGSNVHRRSD